MTYIITEKSFGPDLWAGVNIPEYAHYNGERAVLLPVDVAPQVLIPHFDRLDLIVIPFASSADGRGFSHAALLRDLGYRGHIRARGHILVDQFRAAKRSGIDDLEITKEQAARNPQGQWQNVVWGSGYRSQLFAQEVSR